MFRALCLLGCLLISAAAWGLDRSSLDTAQYAVSERSLIHDSQGLIDAGALAKAKILLEIGMQHYPKSDQLLALYGQLLYQQDEADKAEHYLMQALRLNGGNTIALQYIKLIRLVRSYRESEDAQEWDMIYKDKLGALLAFVISVWLGTSLNTIWSFFVHQYQWTKAKRDYKRQLYEALMLILVAYVNKRQQAAINRCLVFMLAQAKGHVSQVSDLIRTFVVSKDDQEVLCRSLSLLQEKKALRGVSGVA